MVVEILNLDPPSDGDPTLHPPDGWKLVDPPHLYLHKLAEQWQENAGRKTPGVRYYLNKLPPGYRLFEKARLSNPNIIDKHLYGSPSGKFFDSPNRFYPHFEHLMKNGNSIGCTCSVCSSASSRPLSMSDTTKKNKNSIKSQAPNDDGRVGQTSQHKSLNTVKDVDEEGTPDVLSSLIRKLKLKSMDEEMTEPRSMDWVTSKHALEHWLNYLNTIPSWVPRQGEIILFVRTLHGMQIDYDNSDDTYKMFDEATNQFIGLPFWEAGIIGQDPKEPIHLSELAQEVDDKEKGIAYTGFRVEPLFNAASSSNTRPKGYKYVPLHHIRPFAFWERFLKGHAEHTWHPSVRDALKVMSSVCLVNRYRFRGTWPSADVFCSGIYLGSEFLRLGDTIGLAPMSGDTVVDFLEIDSIKLRLTNLDKKDERKTQDDVAYNYTIVLRGKAFTSDASSAWTTDPIERAKPRGLAEYEDDIFWLHDPAKFMQIPFSRALGRCYDAQATLMWFPHSAAEHTLPHIMSYSLSGIREARKFSSTNDTRILAGKTWFWGDSRLEILGLEALNNVYSTQSDELREEKLEEWKFTNNQKKALGRPPKLEKHPMAVGLEREQETSVSDFEHGNGTMENPKKRTFSVVIHATSPSSKSYPRSEHQYSSTEESSLGSVKKPRTIVLIDD